MATKEELTEQLSITQKLSAAVDSMARSMSKVEASYETQISAVEKLTRAIEALKGQDLGNLNQQKLDGLQKEMKDSEKTVTSLSGRIKSLGDQVSKKFPSNVAIGAAALTGFAQGVRNVIALSKGLAGFFATFADGAISITASIISIPLKIFTGLVDMAAAAGGGANELAQALENLRKEMGDLKGPGTSAVLEASKSLKGFSDTGLSAWRVFGTMAERIELVTKVAVAMGATFGRLTEEFKQNGGALLAFQKGLGVSEEGMKAVGDRAISLGKPMTKIFMDMTKQTLALGKAFDIDQKLIGKDMVKAMQDVKHFGALTVKEIATASVYSRKLGVELDKIVGTLDAFETFDTAAENAAKLSQAFGVNIDAFKMMEAQSPAEQMDMLRKSFRDAGVDASQFTRQQAKLLAMTTGLDEATVRQTFSMQNQGASLDDIKKKSESAEKKTMTQAEAMSKLADSIERMVKSGGSQTGGFWDMFVKGFLGGIQASKEFREIIMNIKQSLNLVYFEGIRLGKAFVEMFPGVKMFLGGIADFFKPGKFKALVGGVVDELIKFMGELKNPNGKASFSGLMKTLQEKFFNFFDGSTQQGKDMLDGFKTMFKTIMKLASEGIKWVSDQIGEGLQYAVDLITGKKNLSSLASAGGGALGFLGEVLEPLLDALEHAWVTITPKLAILVKELGKKLYDYLTSKEFIDIVKPAIPVIAAILMGPAFTRALMGAAAASLGKAAIGLFTRGDTKKIMADVAKKAASELSEASQKVASKGAGVGADGLKQVGAVNKAAGDAINPTGSKDWGVKDAVRLGAKLVAIAAALAIGGVAMAVGIVAMKKILEAGGIKNVSDALAPLSVMGAMVLGAIPLMISMKMAAKLGSMSEVLNGGLIISVLVGIVGVVGAGVAYLLSKVGDPAQLSAAGNIMAKMSLVFLAMVPLIFASMAVGALASGPQAIALAAAAIGLAVISKAVADMAELSIDIIEKISAIKVNSQFQQKIDAFLGIMKAIQSFSDTLVNMISLMTPTFTELLSGKTESFSEKVTSATKLIKEMVGKRGSESGMIGIIETVMSAIKQMNIGGPGMAEAAKVFSDVMSAITAFMIAAAPPESFYEEGGSFINRLVDPSHNFTNLTTDVARYSRLMREGAMEMLTGDKSGSGKEGILGLITKMTTMKVPDTKAAEVIANLISSTASVLKALSPNADTMKAFSDTKETEAFWGLVKGKTTKLNTAAIAETISSMGEQFKVLIPALTSSVLDSVTDKAKNLTGDQITKIKAMGDILKIVVDLTTALGNAMKGAPTSVGTVNEGAIVNITSQAPSLAIALSEIESSIGPLLETLANLPVVDASVTTNGVEGMIGLITKSIDSVSKIGDILSADSMELVMSSVDQLTAYGDEITRMASVLKNDAIAGALTAASDIIKKANELDQALNDGIRIDTPVKLAKLASAVGLGSKTNYTIRNKEIVLTVNMQVTMNVDEVEKVMILRKGSFVRDRINLSLEGDEKTRDYTLPENPSSPIQMPAPRQPL